jgi:hypothetical protein
MLWAKLKFLECMGNFLIILLKPSCKPCVNVRLKVIKSEQVMKLKIKTNE